MPSQHRALDAVLPAQVIARCAEDRDAGAGEPTVRSANHDRFGDRRYRVRGLEKNPRYDVTEGEPARFAAERCR